LYRRGDVRIGGIGCADGYREQAIRLAKEAALALYDEVYPDVAFEARAFVEKSIEDIGRFEAIDEGPLLAAGAGKQLAADQFLAHLLDLAKAELEKTGEVVQRIGWHVHDTMALFPIGAPPFEKCRYFRAVAEVARKVGADAVVYVSDGYLLTRDGQRTGEEVLQIAWVNPDGTSVSMAAGYTRRKHPQLKHDIITLSAGAAFAHKSEQPLIPAWGPYQPN
jgi:hypothetical protein